MNNEYYGAASTPTEDFLAHYGVKGMKWGVRKAIERGSDRALKRQRVKAEKKLKKLQKLGSNGKKYAKRAARYGVGAAIAGGAAALGTSGIGTGLRGAGRLGGQGVKAIGTAMEGAGRYMLDNRKGGKVGSALVTAGRKTRVAGGKVSSKANAGAHAIEDWGKSTSMSGAARSALEKNFRGKKGAGIASGVSGRLNGMSNSTIARIGAGAVSAGLGAAAAKNAYRAATAKKHARQAEEFKREMNKAFAGTKYANGVPTKRKKRR